MARCSCKNYVITLILLIIVALFMVNCGGGESNSGVIPNIPGGSTEGQNLVTKDISGYIYHINSSFSKDGEEETDDFVILDAEIGGEEGFAGQINSFARDSSSSKTVSSETEELLNAFNEEVSAFTSLPAWNSGAGLYSVYDDSENSSPLPVVKYD